jgi:ABC-type glutathione transport system ATPase component
LPSTQRIGTGGVTLSGGQEQCIAICRALIKRPAALILDEYTAALDGPTQKRVASNIAKLQKDFGFTIVQIAHRLETLTNSDCLYFLEHGKVVESIMTDDRTATKALLKVPIKHRATRNGLTGENMEKVTAGYFHATWNSNFDVKDIHKMKLNDLEKREKELEEELTLVRDVSLKKRSSDDLDNFLGAPPTRLPQICCKATSSLSSDYNEYNHNSSSSNSNEGA